MNKLQLGKYGEELAVKYLKKAGYKIIEKNFQVKGGEIDIIAKDKDTLVYIEVKTRSSHKFGLPQEAVTVTKLKFLTRAAKFYRNARKNLPEQERIDVVAIDLTSGSPSYLLIKNAFI